MAEFTYARQSDAINIEKIRGVVSGLPSYVSDFMRAIAPRTTTRTRLAYAYDLRVFFEYLHGNNTAFSTKEIKSISLEDLESLAPVDFEEYLSFLSARPDVDGTLIGNEASGLHRKLSALSSLYRYLHKQQRISSNPVELVDRPKIREKAIIRLDVDEIVILLDNVESGENQTERQKKYNESFRTRDLAILTLLLGTGIRVSELVGLDLTDVDYRNGSIMVFRKGGKVQEIYFSDEVEEALYAYMEEREEITPLEGHSSALFLSSQKKRISVRTVEVLVKKYAATIGTNKHITPHKLRSTYGTALYHETGDIYLVADVLGHSDVNTTKKHYSAIQEDTRRSARDKVRLRKD